DGALPILRAAAPLDQRRLAVPDQLGVEDGEVVADVMPDDRGSAGPDVRDGGGDARDRLLGGHAVFADVLGCVAVNLGGLFGDLDAGVDEEGRQVDGVLPAADLSEIGLDDAGVVRVG